MSLSARGRWLAVPLAVLLTSVAAARRIEPPPAHPARINGTAVDDGVLHPNDLTRAAGRLEAGVLTVQLETRTGTWYAEGPGSTAADSMLAIAEVGRPSTTPAPLLRVPRGTTVRGTLRNTLPRTLVVYGLGKSRASSDSLVIAAGATGTFTFTANTAGTYPWWVKSGELLPGLRLPTDMSGSGVLVVDEPGRTNDRVLALTAYFTLSDKSRTGLGRGTMAINGLSWPHTQHLAYSEGDSVRWQVVNLTELDHPMHLHGFYFRVNGVNAGGLDSMYTPAQQRMAVTEVMPPFSAMRIAFKAERPGNWVFHCHYALHLAPKITSMDSENGEEHPEHAAGHPSDMPHHMSGLVLAMTVAPRSRAAVLPAPAREFRLEQRDHRVAGPSPMGSLTYTLTERGVASKAMALSVPAAPLILERGKRIAVNVVNQSAEHAAVHWHGIELESAADGVPGVSGAGRTVMPMIHPHDSLTVRWTPPRAGSFMYHTHANESMQMGAGLYGPIIVLEPGEKFDPEHDRVLFFGSDGELENVISGTPPPVVLNGSAAPAPMEFRAGQRYRLRFFNLAGDFPTMVIIAQQDKPVMWRALAKDGFALPAAQAVQKPAVLVFEPGEIYDFEFAPTAAGAFTLSFGIPPIPGAPPPPPMTKVTLTVR